MLNIYSSEEEVVRELNARWENPELEAEVLAFLDGNIPPPLRLRPRAVLARQLATPDNEFKEFMNKSQRIGLPPLDFEYLDDLFTTNNHGKTCLAKMVFYQDSVKPGAPRTSSVRVIDLSGCNENKRFRDIVTLRGEPFADFHHRLLNRFYTVETYDGSHWYKEMGGQCRLYYQKYFALLTIRHVLFENIEADGEDRFINEVFLPALESVQRHFGIKPLLLPVAPPGELNNQYWWCYPQEVKPFAEAALKTGEKQ